MKPRPVFLVLAVASVVAGSTIASAAPLLATHPQLTGFSVHPPAITGGSSSQGTVTLASAAPAGGTLVSLTSDPPLVAFLPATVLVPEGTTSGTFAITTHLVVVSTQVTLRATLGTDSLMATLTVSPLAATSLSLAGLSLTPSSVTGGGTAQGTVTLSAVAPAGGTAVSLTSSAPLTASVPAAVVVPAGSTSASFTVSTQAVTASTTATIVATLGTVTRSATVTVQPAGSPPPSSNAAAFVAVTGSDANSCSQVAPCASFNRAYEVAKAGQTVEVAAGGYGPQTINAGAKSDYVTFKPATGAAVTVNGDFIVNSPYVKVTSGGGTFTVAGEISAYNNSTGVGNDHVIFDGVTGRNLTIKGDNITFTNGSLGGYGACVVGGSSDNDGVLISTKSPGVASSSITISNTTIHDINDYVDGASGARCSGTKHVDCIQAFGANNLLISSNHFYNCATSWVLIKPDVGTSINGVTIENNMGGPNLVGGNGFLVGDSNQDCGATPGIVIRYNTMSGQQPQIGCLNTDGSSKLVGNLFLTVATSICNPGLMSAAISYNAWPLTQTGPCTTTTSAKTCNPLLLTVSSLIADLRLSVVDTCAKDSGDSSFYPATDILGTSRPQGAKPDIGAHEVSSSAARASDAMLRVTVNRWSRKISADAHSVSLAARQRHARRLTHSALRVRRDALRARIAIAAHHPSAAKGRRARQLALTGFANYAAAGSRWAASGRERLKGHKAAAARFERKGAVYAKAGNRLLVSARKVLR